nr:TlpA disulfide reductase family protein [Litorivivens lipolytica]
MKRLVLVALVIQTPSTLALATGDTLPDFTRPGLIASGELSSRQFIGRVVYLDFWASWCGPCRLSLPALNEFYHEFSDQGFVVVAINLDEDAAEGRRFLKRFPVSYPVLKDDGSLPEALGVKGMPTGFLLDRQGRVRAIHRGFKPGDQTKLRREIKLLLAED